MYGYWTGIHFTKIFCNMQLPPKASPTLWLYMLWTFLDHGQLWSLCIRGQKFFESIFTPSNYLQRNWTKWRKEVSSIWIHILAPLAGRYSICYCVEDDKSNCRAGSHYITVDIAVWQTSAVDRFAKLLKIYSVRFTFVRNLISYRDRESWSKHCTWT